jgi:hypothetical protein
MEQLRETVVRGSIRLRVRGVVSAALALGMLAVLAATAAAVSPSGWSVEPLPNPPGATWSTLLGLSCTSSTACTAVGYFDAPGGAAPFAEQLVGGRWSIQTMPLPAAAIGGSGSEVSCASAVFCVAAGEYSTGSPMQRALAELWDGGSWSIQTVPEPPGATESHVDFVSCPSTSFCAAVVFANTGQLVVRWDGTSWSVWEGVPELPGGITALSCPSVTSCTLVGGYSEGVQYTAYWDGNSWSSRGMPSVPGAGNITIEQMSCTASPSCIASGDLYDKRGYVYLPFVERWDGNRWSPQSLPEPPNSDQALPIQLWGISCASSTACTVVGNYDALKYGVTAMAERWDGRSWSIQPLPGRAASGLTAVSCTTTASCTAVGGGGDMIAAQWTAVVLPSNQFTVRHVRVHRNGTVEFDVTVPDVGQLDVLETNWTPAPPKRAQTVLLHPGPHRYAFARRHLDIAHARTLHVTVRPSAIGARQVRHHYRPVRINLWVTYQPTGGTPANAAFINLFVTR